MASGTSDPAGEIFPGFMGPGTAYWKSGMEGLLQLNGERCDGNSKSVSWAIKSRKLGKRRSVGVGGLVVYLCTYVCMGERETGESETGRGIAFESNSTFEELLPPSSSSTSLLLPSQPFGWTWLQSPLSVREWSGWMSEFGKIYDASFFIWVGLKEELLGY